jgi:HEXXH motif-containing protein
MTKMYSLLKGIAGGRAAALCFAQYPDVLARVHPDNDSLRSLLHSFSLLSNLNAQVFIDEATPFLWQSFRRFQRAVEVSRDDLAVRSNDLRQMIFDAFFERLPDGTSVTLACTPGDDLVFPKLRLQVSASGPTVSLRQKGPGSLEIRDGAQISTIETADAPASFRLPMIEVPGYPHSRIVLSRSRALFEETIADENLVPRDLDAEGFADEIAEAMRFIADASEDLGASIEKSIKWFVPVSTPGVNLHRSFTLSNLPGLIFLSPAIDGWPLAEAIVHEYLHDRLNSITEIEPVCLNCADKFYSPWRDDPRPLLALFHALFVMGGLLDFFRKVENTPKLASFAGAFRQRRADVFHELRLGLAQIPLDRLTATGREILGEIHAVLEDQAQDLAPAGPALPGRVARHLESWRRANPSLADAVREPLWPT